MLMGEATVGDQMSVTGTGVRVRDRSAAYRSWSAVAGGTASWASPGRVSKSGGAQVMWLAVGSWRSGAGAAVEERTTSSTGGVLAGGRSSSGFSMACTRSLSPSFAGGVEGLAHGGQRGVHVGEDGVVVEADDADVVRHTSPASSRRGSGRWPCRRPPRTPRSRWGRQPVRARRVSGGGRPVALDEQGCGPAPFLQCAAIPRDGPWRRTTAEDRRGDGPSYVPDPADVRSRPGPAGRRPTPAVTVGRR